MAGDAEIGALRVRLAMDAGKFIRSTRRASRASDRMAKRIGKALGGLGLAAGSAAIAVTRASEQIADQLDMLNKKARTAGVASDFYQTLEFAAVEAGVEQQKLNKGLETFLKRVGEARLGLGPLASKLKEYDQQLFEAVKTSRSQEEALRLVADAMQRETDAANRGALAAAAFSKANLDLVRVLEQGSEGLTRTEKKARDFSSIIDQHLLDKMSELNNRIGTANKKISKNWQAMMATMAEEAAVAREQIADLTQSIREMFFSFRDVQELPLTDARRQLSETERELERVNQRIEKLRRDGPQGAFGQMNPEFQLNEVLREREGLLAKQKELAARITELSQRRLANEHGINEARDAREEGQGFDTQTVTTATLLNDQIARGMRLMETAQTPMERYREQIDAINAAQAKGIGNTQKWQSAQNRAALMVASGYAGLAGDVAGSLGSIFGESKGWAIAQAVINTAQAVTATLAQYGGTPWGWANAAAAAAAGAAEIATIRRTSKGSGSSSSGSQVSSAAASASSAQSSGGGGVAQGGGVRQGVNITLQGDSFSREQVLGLIDQFNDALADGAQLNVSAA